ncbi:MAG TPA: tRNA guanosine(34) transglycosylase Tgt [Chloroflexi bacterium]|nr:tRNA guanosine(34) transglycosylase Tgt [Chloroflexota bacterium]HRA30779.1 tRNA guanosine(34) transglycosylase Tgt [Thermomicrobiales bacterium]
MAEARATLTTRRGEIAMPAFLPDATRAVVRGVTSSDLVEVGTPALVVNAFHLLRRPGVRVVQAHGGIHAFMGWDRPVLSDSGGFQVYSLIRQNPDYGVIRANEVIFREPDTGEKWTLTPERVIQIQFQLGSDIVVCLDDCTDVGAGLDEQERAVERTIRWARRCREEYNRLAGQMKREQPPLIFAVVQGGGSEALRRACAQALVEIGFDGFGFGGWPLDADGALLTDVLGWVADALPPDAPKHALGIGSPAHVVTARALGYTTFDSSFPTRDARHNRLYVFQPDFPERAPRPGERFYRTLYILDADYRADREPVDPGCDCPLCRTYSRAYLHHLFKIGDAAGERLATLHNLRFYARLLAALP